MSKWFACFLYLLIGAGVAVGNIAQKGPPYRYGPEDFGVVLFWPGFVSARLTFLYLDTRYKDRVDNSLET